MTRKEVSLKKLCIILAVLLVVSAVFCAYFALGAEQTRAEAAKRETALQDELFEKNAAISEMEVNIAAFQGEIADYKDKIAALEEDVDSLQERLNTKYKTGLDPVHPAYMDKYPDFYAPQSVSATYTPANTVCLTFDDGPSANTPVVLDALAKQNVKATFFVVTKKGYSKEMLKAIADAGHTIGMHSASHEYRTIYASVDAFLDDQYKVFCEIRDVTGQTPTAFRFPGGSINSYNHSVYQEIIAEMLRRGFIPYDWNVSSGDATANTVPKADIVSNVLNTTAMSYAIILMHDGSTKTTTAEGLPEIIEGLKAKGYSFAPIQPNFKPTLFQYIDTVK